MVDFFYVKPLRRIIPLETFRYAVCGGINMLVGVGALCLLYKYGDTGGATSTSVSW